MLKITKYFLFASLFCIGSFALPTMLAFAQQATEVQSIVRFTPFTGDYRGTTFEKVIAPGGAVPFTGDYRLKTRLALQQEPVQQVVETLDLNWTPPAGVTPDGWLQSEGSWRWVPGPQKSSVGFPVVLPIQSKGQQAPAVGDFDEMWFDYRDRGGSDNCDLSFTADAQAALEQKSATTLRIETEKAMASLRPTLRLQAAKDVWLPLDRAYRLKRTLNMDFDEHWRNRQVGEHTELQKRFHRNLDGIEVLDFMFKPEAEVERITLRIAHDKWFGSDTMISWDIIPHKIDSLPDGSMRVRLQIGEWLRQKNDADDGSQKFFLSEAIVLLKGTPNELVRSRPLQEIIFFENEINPATTPATTGQMVSLLGRTELLAPGYKRWILDLRPLTHGKWFDVRMKRALLAISPGDPERQCALQPLALSLVSMTNGKEPIYIADTRRLLRRLGGPFNAANLDRKEVEWAQTDAYLPFSLLPADSHTVDQSMGVQRFDLPEWGLSLSTSREWITQRSTEGLSFEGQGGRIEMSWELPSIAILASSTLFLRVLKNAKHINSGEARIDFNDGSSSSINFLPNQPIQIGVAAAGKRATRVTLDLKLDNSPATLVMQELALFRPFLISQTDAFNARRPAWEFLPLRTTPRDSQKAKGPAIGELVVHGTAEPDLGLPKIWLTRVNLPAKNLNAVKIVYALSELPHEPCWLILRAYTARNQASLTVCPGGTQGQLIQPLAQLVKKLGAEDTVLNLEWEANPRHAAAPLTFDIQAQLGSSSLPSVRELLAQNVLVKVGRQSYLPLDIPSTGIDGFASRRIGWLDFGEINLLAGQKPDVDPAVFHPYVQVQKLILENDHPLTTADIEQLYPSKERATGWPYRIIKLVLMLALGVVAWLLWRSGIWQKTWKAFWFRIFGREKYRGGLVSKLWLRVVTVQTSLARAMPPVAVCVIFSAATLALYAFGLSMRNEQGENYFFTLGGILAVFSWRALLRYARERIFRAFPNLAYKIYGGQGTIYFTGALVGLLVTAGLLALNLAPFAEQVAVVVYYFLVVGTVLEMLELRRATKKTKETKA
jgi:hypothetical protein